MWPEFLDLWMQSPDDTDAGYVDGKEFLEANVTFSPRDPIPSYYKDQPEGVTMLVINRSDWPIVVSYVDPNGEATVLGERILPTQAISAPLEGATIAVIPGVKLPALIQIISVNEATLDEAVGLYFIDPVTPVNINLAGGILKICAEW